MLQNYEKGVKVQSIIDKKRRKILEFSYFLLSLQL